MHQCFWTEEFHLSDFLPPFAFLPFFSPPAASLDDFCFSAFFFFFLGFFLLRCFLLWFWSLLLWCWLLYLGVKMASLVASLLSQDHDLESIEVGKVLSEFVLLHLDRDWSLLEFSINILALGLLDESASSATSMDLVNLDLGQRKSTKWVNASWHLLVSAIDQHSAVVNHINDDNQFTIIITIVDVANSTWFDKISKTLYTTKQKFNSQFYATQSTAHIGVFCLPAIRII